MLSIIHIQDLKSLATYKEQWNDVLQKSNSNNIFLSYEWISQWWQNFNNSNPLLILLALEDGNLIGIAPLYLKSTKIPGFRTAQQVRLLADKFVGSDFLDFIIIKNREAEVIPDLLKYLSDHFFWHHVYLDDYKSDSINLSILQSVIKPFRLSSYIKTKSRCPYLILPDTIDAFLKLPDKTYKKIIQKKTVTKLYKEHDVKILFSITASDLDMYLEKLFQLYSERWEYTSNKGMFNNPQIRDFFKNISGTLCKLGLLRLSAIVVDEEIMAMEYGMLHHDTYYSLQGGCSKKGLSLRAGTALTFKIFESLIGQAHIFHYLRGEEPYKYKWGCVDSYTSSVQIWKGTHRIIMPAIHIYKDKIKTAIKKAKRTLF
ncbi:MAG: GNAT family N-acetyltransferase [Chlamydiota bacterium]|nr:GNAT family N-acetyltransferase [Chlamydiota bacterium]